MGISWYGLRDEFLRFLRSLGRSTNTLDAYTIWLNRFVEYCADEKITSPAAFTPEDLNRFHHRMCWSPGPTGVLYSQYTVDLALRAVRSMFVWAVDHEKLLVSPARDLVLGRLRGSTRRMVAVEEMARLLGTPDKSTPDGLRNRAVLELLYSTGLRRLECHRLDIEDLDLDGRTLRVYGKGDCERLVPVGERLAAVLDLYLAEARPILLGGYKHRRAANPDQKALFLSTAGTRYCTESISKLVTNTAKSAGLERVTAHAVRHAFATHMLEGGADFRALQQLLGHKTVQTTQIYAHVTPAELRRVHRETHPRARRITSIDAAGDLLAACQ